MLWTVLFIGLAAAQGSTSNSSMPTSTTTTFDEGVPTNAPVPGDYSGALRPQIHYSPPTNFMNDPNGCFLDDNGTWHLYYQCNNYLLRKDMVTNQSQTILLPLLLGISTGDMQHPVICILGRTRKLLSLLSLTRKYLVAA
jgi:hypothetical protein